jgi:hypothetical protein
MMNSAITCLMLTLDNLFSFSVDVVIVILTALILFLPAIIELKKPKDSGPRLIEDNFAKKHIGILNALVNIEGDQNSQLTISFLKLFCPFSDLEA